MMQTAPNGANNAQNPCKPADSVLPTQELKYAEEMIGFEKLLVKKYRAYGLSASDPNLKALFERAELMHHHHQDIVTGCVAAGNKPAPAGNGMCS